MCVNDWRLGRFIKTSARTISVTAGTPVPLGSNPQRVGVLLCGDLTDMAGGATYSLEVNGVPVTYCNASIHAELLSLTGHGDLPTKSINVTTFSGGPFTCYVTEFFLPEEFLQKGTKEWQQVLMGP